MAAASSALLDTLVEIVIRENASDLHLSVGRSPVIRVSGFLVQLDKIAPLTQTDIDGMTAVFFSSENMREFALRKEANFAYAHKNIARFRGNAYLELGMTSIALRLIPSKIKTFQELNLPDALANFARREQGFFLVVGPAGQGKSTTLASMIDFINQERLE